MFKNIEMGRTINKGINSIPFVVQMITAYAAIALVGTLAVHLLVSGAS